MAELHATTMSLTPLSTKKPTLWKASLRTSSWLRGPYGKAAVSPRYTKSSWGRLTRHLVKDGQATNPGVENTNGTPVGQWRLAVLKIGSEAGHVRGILADPPCPQLHLALTAPRLDGTAGYDRAHAWERGRCPANTRGTACVSYPVFTNPSLRRRAHQGIGNCSSPPPCSGALQVLCAAVRPGTTAAALRQPAARPEPPQRGAGEMARERIEHDGSVTAQPRGEQRPLVGDRRIPCSTRAFRSDDSPRDRAPCTGAPSAGRSVGKDHRDPPPASR